MKSRFKEGDYVWWSRASWSNPGKILSTIHQIKCDGRVVNDKIVYLLAHAPGVIDEDALIPATVDDVKGCGWRET